MLGVAPRDYGSCHEMKRYDDTRSERFVPSSTFFPIMAWRLGAPVARAE